VQYKEKINFAVAVFVHLPAKQWELNGKGEEEEGLK
jgi:hypothetical protein